MKIFLPKSILFCFILLGFISTRLEAQLGFCGGSSGEPIFSEDFGSGTTDGPALPMGTTSYNFTTGTPFDGDYTISSTTNYFDWLNVQDHTPGDSNGKSFIVNASFTAGEFYQREVTGLCENTSYEFSAWLINLLAVGSCDNNSIPVNVRFQIWDETDTNLLAQGDTGSIFPATNSDWEQYALVFKTEPGQGSVILKMRNNSNGGCGNDLAIDDILFKSCGDIITTSTNNGETHSIVCESQTPISTTITASPDNAIFTSHAYQWQQSTDQQNWVDIPGETDESLNTSNITETTYFRTKVAEDIANVNNDLCNVVSDTFSIIVLPIPDAPVSNGDVTICEGEIGTLQVSVPNLFSVDWYDAPIGGNLLSENSATYETDINGTYYAETVSLDVACSSTTRTEIVLIVNPLPVLTNEDLTFCEDTTVSLNADLDDATYEWSTGATTKEIIVGEAGDYAVIVTNTNGCSTQKTIRLEQIDKPIIERISSDGPAIVITTENTGNFEYSLDGTNFQTSAIFEIQDGGPYTIYVRGSNDCGLETQEFFHLVIPKFFTPNGDGTNDTFEIDGLDAFASISFSIFDRYGTLLKSGNSNTIFWDGSFQGKEMPANDYWYLIRADQSEFKGHFSLKR